MYIRFLYVALFFSFSLALCSQQNCPPFWNDILAFKKMDAAKPPPYQAILLMGSSSFANWKDVNQYFPGYPIVNRCFGGSTLIDLIRYTYEVALPYRPKQILIYCGENDLDQSATVQAEEVVRRFKTLYAMLRHNLPHTFIHYISLKPSPSRQHLMPKMQKVNATVKTFLARDKKAGFIDVYSSMLRPDGRPKEEIFLEDKLHMNRNGYVIWQKIISPYLLK